MAQKSNFDSLISSLGGASTTQSTVKSAKKKSKYGSLIDELNSTSTSPNTNTTSYEDEQNAMAMSASSSSWTAERYAQISAQNQYDKYKQQLSSIEQQKKDTGLLQFGKRRELAQQHKETSQKLAEAQNDVYVADFLNSGLSVSEYLKKQKRLADSGDKEANARIQIAQSYQDALDKKKKEAAYDSMIKGSGKTPSEWYKEQQAYADSLYGQLQEAQKKYTTSDPINNYFMRSSKENPGADQYRETNGDSSEVERLNKMWQEAQEKATYGKNHQYDNISSNADYKQNVEAGRQLWENSDVYLKRQQYANEELGSSNNPAAAPNRINAYLNQEDLPESNSTWTDDERNTYYYLLGSGNEEDAKSYAVDTNNRHIKEDNDVELQKYSDNSNILGATAAQVGSMVTAIPEAAYNLAEYGISKAATGEGHYTANPNLSFQQKAEAMTSGVSQRLNNTYGVLDENNDSEFLKAIGLSGKGVGDVYQMLNSVVQSQAGMKVATATGVMAFTDVAFFATSFNSALREGLDRGLSPDKATYVALANGINEALFEHLSLDKLMENSVPASTFKQFTLQILEQAGIEGTEEFNTTLANTIAEALILGDKSQINENIRNYMSQGLSYDDASKQAMKDFASGAIYDFLAGAASGGIGAGKSTIQSSLSTYASNEANLAGLGYLAGNLKNGVGKAVTGAIQTRNAVENARAQQLIAEAQDSTSKAAQDLGSKYEGKKKLTGGQAQKILNELESTRVKALQDEMSERTVHGDREILARALLKEQDNRNNDERDGVKHKDYKDLSMSERNAILQNEGLALDYLDMLAAGEGFLADRTSKSVQEVRHMKSESYSSGEQDVHTSALTVNSEGKIVAQAKYNGKEGYTQVSVENLPEAQRNFVETATKMLGAEGAVAAYNAFDASTFKGSTYEYLNDFQLAQTLGRATVDQNNKYLQGIAKRIGTEAVTAAYNDGAKLAKQDDLTKGNRKVVKGSGKVYLDGGEFIDENGNKVVLKGVDLGEYKGRDREEIVQAINAVQTLAEKIGIDIHFYASEESTDELGNTGFFGAQGAYTEGEIWLDINAGMDSAKDIGNRAVLRTMSHELTHYLQANDVQTYRELMKYMIENMSEEAFVQAFYSKMNRRSVNGNTGKALDEMVADGCEMMLQNSYIVNQLATDNMNLFQKIKKFVDNFIKQIKSIYGAVASIEARDLTGYAEKMQEIWDRGLQNAIRNINVGYAEQLHQEELKARAMESEMYGTEFEQALYEEGKTTVHGVTYSVEKSGNQFYGKYEGEDGGIKVLGSTMPYNSVSDVVDALADRATTPKRILNENGELVIAKAADGHTLVFSERTWYDNGKDALMRALQEEGHTREEIEQLVGNVEQELTMLKQLSDELKSQKGYEKLAKNLDATITVSQITGKQILSALVNNGDYPLNIDLSLICKKRVAYMRLMNRLIADNVLSQVTYDAKTIAKVNEILRNNGFETACLGCFVESRRQQFQAWAETVVNEWNRELEKLDPNAPEWGFTKLNFKITNDEIEAFHRMMEEGEAEGKLNDQGNFKLGQGSSVTRMGNYLKDHPETRKKLTVADLLTAEGLKKLKATDPTLFSIAKSRYGAAAPKVVQEYNPYNGEVANLSYSFVKEMIHESLPGRMSYVAQAKKKFEKRAGESSTAYTERMEREAIKQYCFDIGGVRIQSFSDFMIENTFDYVQIIADLAARKLPLHGYTKEQSALRLFGLSGMKFNGSWIAHNERSALEKFVYDDRTLDGLDINEAVKKYSGLLPVEEAEPDENGVVHAMKVSVEVDGVMREFAIAMDDVDRNQRTGSFIQSMGMKDLLGIQLDPRYSKNVGSITIGVSDIQIRAMLNDPRFRMVIPYHASGMNPVFAKMVGVESYNDYTSYQNTTVKEYFNIDGTRHEGPFKNKKGEPLKVNTHYDFNKTLQELGDARSAAKAYVDWCGEMHEVYNDKVVVGYVTFNPKFSDSPMNYDFTKEANYYKLLEDFNVYDYGDTENSRQTAVSMTLPSAENTLKALGLEEEYRRRLEDSGMFTESEIQKLIDKGNMTFEDLVRKELNVRADYDMRQEPLWESTVQEIEDELKKAEYVSTPEQRQAQRDFKNLEKNLRAEKKQLEAELKERIEKKEGVRADQIQKRLNVLKEELSEVTNINKISSEKKLKGENEEMREARLEKAMDLKNKFISERSSQFSERDSRYMQLAQNPEANREELQRMVDERAKEAGYNEIAYHGSKHRHNVLKEGFGQYGAGVYFSYDEEAANIYARKGGIVDRYFVKAKIANYTDLAELLGIDNIEEYWEGIESSGDYENDLTNLEYNEEAIYLLEENGFTGFEDEGNDGFVIFDANNARLADPVTYDDSGNIIPLSQRFNSDSKDIRFSERDIAEQKQNIKYSERERKQFVPSNSSWKSSTWTADKIRSLGLNIYGPVDKSSMSEEDIKKEYKRNGTQVTITKSSYEEFYARIKNEHPNDWKSLSICDASSGRGHGTQLGRELGFNVTDIEPFPDVDWKDGKAVPKADKDGKYAYQTDKGVPDYADFNAYLDAQRDGKKFDIIISNAVLNVTPQEQRDDLLWAMDNLLKVGGEMYINVRTVADVSSAKAAIDAGDYKSMESLEEAIKNIPSRSRVILDRENTEYFVGQSNSYQKGFRAEEFIGYITDALDGRYEIENLTGTNKIVPNQNNKYGKVNGTVVHITKLSEDGGSRQFSERENLNDEQKKFYDKNMGNENVGSKLVTLKGSSVSRYKNVVGKEIGGQIYFHKNYINDVIGSGYVSKEAWDKAVSVMREKNPEFLKNASCVMIDKKKGTIRFDESPDFDTAREPIPGKMVTVHPSGEITEGYSDYIWHHKWLWVKNDYKGFDVSESWNWSKQFLSTIRDDGEKVSNKGVANGSGHGTTNWNKQLEHFGLPVDTKFSERDSKGYAPKFYSQMQRVIEQKMPNKMSVDQVEKFLLGKGVKAEEIKWSGIKTFMEGKKSVSKDELLQFAKENQIQIEEETRGFYGDEKLVKEYKARKKEAVEEQKRLFKVLTDDIMVRASDWVKERVPSWDGSHVENPEFKAGYNPYGYTLSQLDRLTAYWLSEWNGTGYDQKLYNEWENSEIRAEIEENQHKYFEALMEQRNSDEAGKEEFHKDNSKWGKYILPGGKNYREILFKMPGAKYTNKAMRVHWDTSGVLAHARVQDMTVGKEKVMFIEEIQSDWHNAGHKDGYANEGLKGDYSKITIKQSGMNSVVNMPIWTLRDGDGMYLGSITRPTEQEAREAFAPYYEEERKRALSNLTPEAPYKETYTDFVMKNLLRQAAENGYDKIAWTSAEVQSKRWSDEFSEGYRIEYDQYIPKFMRKYCKQWGATVGTTVLKTGDEVWSVDINDSMRSSVLYEGQPQFSERDSKYMELAKDPVKNKEQLDKLVRQRAIEAGYTSKKLFHGTDNFGFTNIDTKYSDDGISFFATDSWETANSYSRNAGNRTIGSGKETGSINAEEARMTSENALSETSESFADYINDFTGQKDYKGYHFEEWGVSLAEDLAYYEKIPEVVEDELFEYLNDEIIPIAFELDDEHDDIDEFSDIHINGKLGQIMYRFYVDIQNLAYAIGWEYGEDTTNGNYLMYASEDGLLEIDGKGSDWNQIDLGDLERDVLEWQKNDATGWYSGITLLGKSDTRIISRYAYDRGYSGVKFSNIIDDGFKGAEVQSAATVYSFFYPQKQLKSADAVTYYDNGNVIPLSERFEQNNDDIRFSERDIANRTDAQVAAQAFDDSAKTASEKKALANFKTQLQKLEEARAAYSEASSKLRNENTPENRKAVSETRKKMNSAMKVLSGMVENNSDLRKVIEAERQLTSEGLTAEFRAEYNRQYNELAGVIDILENRIKELKKDNSKESQKQLKKAQHDLKVQKDKYERLVATRERRIQQTKEHNKQINENRKQRASNKKTRDKIKEMIADLNKRLKNPTEKKYIPSEWVQPTIDLLEMINTNPWDENKNPEKHERFTEKLATLKVMYDNLRNDPDFSRAYDASVAEMLGQLVQLHQDIGDTPLNKMTEDQLNSTYVALKAMKTVIENSAKMRIRAKEVAAVNVAQHLIKESREAKKSKNNIGTQYALDMMRPQAVFERFGGFVKDSYWSAMYDILNEGQLKQTDLTMKMTIPFAKLLKDGKKLREFQGRDSLNRLDKSKLIDIGLKDRNGNSIMVTHDIAVGIYLDTLNEQNAKHLAEGGKVIPALDEYYAQKKDGGFGQNEVHAIGFSAELSEAGRQLREAKREMKEAGEDDAVLISQLEQRIEDIKAGISDIQQKSLDYVGRIRSNIESQLTSYDREWIAATQHLFDVQSKEYLDETTMDVYGIKKAVVEHYFPIRTDSDFRSASFDSVTKDMNLENVGFMKARINGANPTLALGVADVVNDQIAKTAQYCGLMPAIKEFEKAYGKMLPGYMDSVQKALHTEMGKYGLKYIDNLMGNLTKSRQGDESLTDRFFSALRGNLAQTSLTLNMRVALAQAASYPTASAIIGRQALTKALFSSEEVDTDEIAKYSPLWWYRMQGYSTAELGDIKNSNTVSARVWKKMRWATGWIQAMDGATTKKLWLASEYYVRDTMGIHKGDAGYYEEVARVYNQVIEETQPNYTVMQRPELLRNTNALQRTLTMFSTQRLQNVSIVYDAYGRYARYAQDLKEGKNGITQDDVDKARDKLHSAMFSQIAAAATIVTMKLLTDMLLGNMGGYRDDDDDEVTKESVFLGVMDNLIDSVVGNLYLGSTAYSFIKASLGKEKWYDISVNGVDSLNSFLSSSVKFLNYIESDGVTGEKAWDKFMDFALDGCQLIGLPLNNGIKLGKAFVYMGEDIVNGDFGTWESSSSRTSSQETNRLLAAYIDGNKEKVASLTESLGGEKKAATKLKSYIKDLYTRDRGNISREEAIEYLTKFLGLEDAEDVVDYWTLLKENPEAKELVNQSQYSKYLEYVQNSGVSLETYSDIKKNADEDGNGSTSQDEMRKYLKALIASGVITQSQAQAVWNSNGWKKSF